MSSKVVLLNVLLHEDDRLCFVFGRDSFCFNICSDPRSCSDNLMFLVLIRVFSSKPYILFYCHVNLLTYTLRSKTICTPLHRFSSVNFSNTSYTHTHVHMLPVNPPNPVIHHLKIFVNLQLRLLIPSVNINF